MTTSQLQPQERRRVLEEPFEQRSLPPGGKRHGLRLSHVLLEDSDLPIGEGGVEDIEVGFVIQGKGTTVNTVCICATTGPDSRLFHRRHLHGIELAAAQPIQQDMHPACEHLHAKALAVAIDAGRETAPVG